ncbi:MAG: permease prefix domain 1-containing protein, partial [Gemmatimonadaceae bacterium]
MKIDDGWQRYWRYLTARFRDEVDDEIAFHIAMRARELQAQGLTPQVAEEEARRRFGNSDNIRSTLHRIEEKRGQRMKWTFLFQELAQDIRYGARALLKRPSFTIMSAGSLAIGIAAVTVVLTIIDAYLLRPLPVRHPEELVVIGASNQASGGMAAGV